MHPLRYSQRKTLLELMFELSVLELDLDQAKDDFKESSTLHGEAMLSFVIEQRMFDIRRKKYEIKHMESLLAK